MRLGLKKLGKYVQNSETFHPLFRLQNVSYHPDVFLSKMPPPTTPCPSCGQAFFPAAMKIHLPQCQKKQVWRGLQRCAHSSADLALTDRRRPP